MTTSLDAANKRPTLEQILRAAPMLARATRSLEPLLLAHGPDAGVSSVTVSSSALTDGKRVPMMAALRDELLRRIDSGDLGYCELDVPMLAYEQREGEPNRNFVQFRTQSMRAIGKTGQGKPFLRDHSQRDSMARGGTLVESATEVPSEGHYEIRQVARLTEPWAIALYLRGNMTTVSIGWIPTGPVLCSACDAPVGEKCGGWWMHWPGDRLKESVDEDGNKVLVESKKGTIVITWIYTAAELIETSCVPVPGVPTAEMDQLRAQLATGYAPSSLEVDSDYFLGVQRKSPPAAAARSVTPQPEMTMADQTPDSAKLAGLRKALVASLALPEAHRLHAQRLAADDVEAFVTMGAADRDVAVKAALDADPVVFTGALTKIVVRESHGAVAKQLAEQNEALTRQNTSNSEQLARQAEERETAEVATICKARLSSLPGSDETHQFIVRSLRKSDGTKEQIDGALATLFAASTNIAKQAKAPGANDDAAPADGDAITTWSRAVDAFAKAHGITDRDDAIERFLDTPAGKLAKQTYDQSRAYGQRRIGA